MPQASIVETAIYLPEKIVSNDFFTVYQNGQERVNPMFKGVKARRHVAEHETAVYMIEQAVNKLHMVNPQEIEMILLNIALPQEVSIGVGAIVAKKIGATPQYIIDLQNSGCISFITMLDLAKTYIESGKVKNALICNVQNSAGTIFAQPETRTKMHACIPGDGCGVAYIATDIQNPILHIVQKVHPENSENMVGCTSDNRKYWQPGLGELRLEFEESRAASVMAVGNRVVPEIMFELCKQAAIEPQEIDFLITNQPSRLFLRNWREALQLGPEKHIQTFEELGNLFGAALPINMDYAIKNKLFKKGNKILLAGFSHAGDFSAAALIDWQTNL